MGYIVDISKDKLDIKKCTDRELKEWVERCMWFEHKKVKKDIREQMKDGTLKTVSCVDFSNSVFQCLLCDKTFWHDSGVNALCKHSTAHANEFKNEESDHIRVSARISEAEIADRCEPGWIHLGLGDGFQCRVCDPPVVIRGLKIPNRLAKAVRDDLETHNLNWHDLQRLVAGNHGQLTQWWHQKPPQQRSLGSSDAVRHRLNFRSHQLAMLNLDDAPNTAPCHTRSRADSASSTTSFSDTE